MSGKEVRKLKTIRNKLAILCPETDGLQEKHRVKYVPEGNDIASMKEDLLNLGMEIVLPGIINGKDSTTQRISRLISLIYSIEGFTQEEVYRMLSSKRYKNRNS